MKTLLTLSIWMCFFAGFVLGQGQTKGYDYQLFGDRRLYDLVEVEDGYLLLGSTERMVETPGHVTTYYTPFVAKLNRGFAILWETKLKESRIPTYKGMTYTGTDIYLAGTESDLVQKKDIALFTKLDNQGRFIEDRKFTCTGHHSTACYDFRLLPDGRLLIFAEAFRSYSSSAVPWLICLDADGKLAWTKLLAQPVVFGEILDAIMTADGNILVSGRAYKDKQSFLTGMYTGYLAKLDPINGTIIWNQWLSNYGTTCFYDISEGVDGRITAVGEVQSDEHRYMLLMRLEADCKSGEDLKKGSLTDGIVEKFIALPSRNGQAFIAIGQDGEGKLRFMHLDANGNILSEVVVGKEFLIKCVFTPQGEMIAVCKHALIRTGPHR